MTHGRNGLFRSILIETRNDCTRKCWHCKFGQERKDESFCEMSWQVIERIIDNLGRLKYDGRISWYCTNEPLLDKRIYRILSLTRKSCPKAFLSLVTNGDLLNKEVYRKLKGAGLDALGVSIYDSATYNKAQKIKDERLVMLDMRSSVPGQLENRAGNVKVNEKDFRDQKAIFQEKVCLRPSTMMVINAKGEAILCCSDMYSDVVLGHVMCQSIEGIWNGETLGMYRKELSERGRKNLIKCKDCSFNGNEPFQYFPFTALSPPARHSFASCLSQVLGRIRRRISSFFS